MTYPEQERVFASADAAVAAAWRLRGTGQWVRCAENTSPLVAWAKSASLAIRWDAHAPKVESDLAVAPPVDLPVLPRSGLPPWPLAADPQAQVTVVREWLRVRAGAAVEWLAWPFSEEHVQAAAALTTEGCRVIWEVPRGAMWTPALLAAVAGRPLKLIMTAADLPRGDLPGWWVVETGDPAQISAVLAQHLRDEFPLMLALKSAEPSRWPVSEAWVPRPRQG